MIRERETCAYELGLLPSEFWPLTPAEFAAVAQARMKAEAARDERASYRTAALLAMLYNVNRGKDQPARRAEDFLSRSGRAGPPLTRAEALAKLKILHLMYSARPDRRKGGRHR